MRFTKMQGAGNDFIIIDNRKKLIPSEKYSQLAKLVCRRRMSMGADGLMIIEPADCGGDFRMMFYNSDGSIGEMCGNGARCIARYGYEHGLSHGDTQVIETASGVVTGKRKSGNMYTVRLADPTVIELERRACADGVEYDCSYVELGTPGLPHAVFLYDCWRDIPEGQLREICRKLRNYEGFPKGANVTFCCITGKDNIAARTFERGVEDFTLACGTGCGSTVAALTLRGLVSGTDVRVSMPGGDLFITVCCDGATVHDIMLTGPTNVIAEGELMDENLTELLEI